MGCNVASGSPRGEWRRDRAHIVPNSVVMNRANGLSRPPRRCRDAAGRARWHDQIVRERQSATLFLELLLLDRSGAVEATVADELHDAAQLVGVEPGAVLRAAVDDDARSLSEVDPVHQLRAERAGDVAHRRHTGGWRPVRLGFRAEKDGTTLSSAQSFWKSACASQTPLHCPHSFSATPPSVSCRSVPQPRGQESALACACTVVIAAPQCAQCLLPTNTSPKHDGHAVVASRAWQNEHSMASAAAAAPHCGQVERQRP